MATVADVRNKHRWEASLTLGLHFIAVPLGRSSLDVDRGAVHVHFTVADFVEPGPSQSILAGRNTLWDCVLESGQFPRRVIWEVAVDAGGTATLDRMNDLPLALSGGLHVGGQANLAGTASVDSTTHKFQSLGLSNDHVIGLNRVVVNMSSQLAREVPAIGMKGRVVQVDGPIGVRLDHLDVSVDDGRGEYGSGHGKGRFEHHVDGWCFDFSKGKSFENVCCDEARLVPDDVKCTRSRLGVIYSQLGGARSLKSDALLAKRWKLRDVLWVFVGCGLRKWNNTERSEAILGDVFILEHVPRTS